MIKLTVLISDPAVKMVETPERVSFCSGFCEEDWQDGEDWLFSETEIERRCGAAGDASVIQVLRDSSVPAQIRAWRPLLSCHEIFFRRFGDGRVLIADHLRNAIADLPFSDRQISDDAFLDFLLFRTVPGAHTYCTGLERLGLGERLSIDLSTGRIERTLFEKLPVITEPATETAYVDRIDTALEQVMRPMAKTENIANLFSGGIDSTLLQSYLGPGVPALTAMHWSVKPYERDYPAEAARVLNIPLQTYEIGESDYLPLLESAIEKSAHPPNLDQIVMVEVALQQPVQALVTGVRADNYFGMEVFGGASARLGCRLSSLPVGPLLKAGAQMAPGFARHRMLRIAHFADRFGRQYQATWGYAGSDGLLTDLPFLESAFGPDHITRRLEARLQYALERMDFSTPEHDRIGRHIELAHWISPSTADGINQFRHLAQYHGKALLSPFTMRPVVESSLRIPVYERYVKGHRSKYLLKALLKQRVPDYPVDQEKGASLFGVEQFFIDGPFQDLWERYSLPEFLTGREVFLSRPNMLTWNVAVMAIWRDRVLRNESLTHTPHMKRWDM